MRKFVYADESGNFDSSRNRGASRYFILTTIAVEEHLISIRLQELRRKLLWNGVEIPNGFHATEDRQTVRDEVFTILGGSNLRIDSTVFDKPKARPELRQNRLDFYSFAWFNHLRFVAPKVAADSDQLMVIGASIGTRREQSSIIAAMEHVIRNYTGISGFRCAVWSAQSDACLQAADYCSWALQR